MHARSRRLSLGCAMALGALLLGGDAVADEEEPTTWEQLFFPFPIVGAPPQLEQQVQVFNSYFHGRAGRGDVPSIELAYIASPHIGLVATVPFQFGFDGQTTTRSASSAAHPVFSTSHSASIHACSAS
jgi:hypothetical protein